jgi:hypothetical protein
MTALVVIFTPFVRLFFHSLAASCGFSGLALITIIPVQIIKLVSLYRLFGAEEIAVFEWVESWILRIDAILLLFVIVIYSIFFIFEQVQALRTLYKLQARGAGVQVQINKPSPKADGGASE